MRGVFRAEPKFLAVFTNLDARSDSARTEIPGDIFQSKCEALSGQNRNSWRYLPICMRGCFRPDPKFLAKFFLVFTRRAFRSGPKFLAIFPRLYARCYSVWTEIPGEIYQFKCEACSSQHRNSWQYLPVQIRGVFLSEPKFLAVFSSLGARCLSVRTQIPGYSYQFECEVFVGQNQNSLRYFPV